MLLIKPHFQSHKCILNVGKYWGYLAQINILSLGLIIKSPPKSNKKEAFDFFRAFPGSHCLSVFPGVHLHCTALHRSTFCATCWVWRCSYLSASHCACQSCFRVFELPQTGALNSHNTLKDITTIFNKGRTEAGKRRLVQALFKAVASWLRISWLRTTALFFFCASQDNMQGSPASPLSFPDTSKQEWASSALFVFELSSWLVGQRPQWFLVVVDCHLRQCLSRQPWLSWGSPYRIGGELTEISLSLTPKGWN